MKDELTSIVNEFTFDIYEYSECHSLSILDRFRNKLMNVGYHAPQVGRMYFKLEFPHHYSPDVIIETSLGNIVYFRLGRAKDTFKTIMLSIE
jgi:hypothetical protein